MEENILGTFQIQTVNVLDGGLKVHCLYLHHCVTEWIQFGIKRLYSRADDDDYRDIENWCQHDTKNDSKVTQFKYFCIKVKYF